MAFYFYKALLSEIMEAIAAFQFIAKINGLFLILINYNGCVFGDKIPLKIDNL